MGLADADTVPETVVLTVDEAAQVLRIGRSLAYQLARAYLTSGGVAGIPVVQIGTCFRVPRWALLELALTGRLVRLCDAQIPQEGAGDVR